MWSVSWATSPRTRLPRLYEPVGESGRGGFFFGKVHDIEHTLPLPVLLNRANAKTLNVYWFVLPRTLRAAHGIRRAKSNSVILVTGFLLVRGVHDMIVQSSEAVAISVCLSKISGIQLTIESGNNDLGSCTF
jgi:hypothetical protein